MKYAGWWVWITVLILTTGTWANEQTGISQGMKVGVTRATIIGADASGFKNLHGITGFSGGFFTQRVFLEKFSLQSELLLTTKGYAYNHTVMCEPGPCPSVFGITALYFDIPVLVGLKVSPLLDIYLGPYIGVLYMAWEWEQYDSHNSRNNLGFDDIRISDFGYIGGVVIKLSRFMVDFRYQRGSIPFLENDLSVVNSQWTLSVGRFLH